MMRAWVFLGLGAALSVLAGGAAARELNPLESLLIDTLQVFSVKSECTDTLVSWIGAEPDARTWLHPSCWCMLLHTVAHPLQ